MKIKTEQHYKNEWTAIDDETYDGPPAPVGSGKTEAEAVSDLLEKVIEHLEGQLAVKDAWIKDQESLIESAQQCARQTNDAYRAFKAGVIAEIDALRIGMDEGFSIDQRDAYNGALDEVRSLIEEAKPVTGRK